MARFDYQTALITGASSGIGYAAARALLERGARRVYISGRDPDRLAGAAHHLGERVVAVQADVARPATLEALRSAVERHGDRLDVLVANAGIAHNNHFGSTGQAAFDTIFDTNVRGVFFTVQTLLPLLNDGASVVLTGSVAGIKGMANLSAYSASKAAVRSFARCWATDLAARRIRVNTVSPGVTETPILSGGLGLDAAALEGLRGYLAAAAPAGRLARAEEIADVIAFLASSDSSYLNGAELCADGGLAQV